MGKIVNLPIPKKLGWRTDCGDTKCYPAPIWVNQAFICLSDFGCTSDTGISFSVDITSASRAFFLACVTCPEVLATISAVVLFCVGEHTNENQENHRRNQAEPPAMGMKRPEEKGEYQRAKKEISEKLGHVSLLFCEPLQAGSSS